LRIELEEEEQAERTGELLVSEEKLREKRMRTVKSHQAEEEGIRELNEEEVGLELIGRGDSVSNDN
jgi:hypothetical protein